MRSHFLEQCAYKGDITSPVKHTGCGSCMIMVKGGNGQIKLQHSDSENGSYADYKVLVESATSETIKGIFVNLDGAKDWLKVVGTLNADVIFGDCEINPKDVIAQGDVPPEKVIYNLYAWCLSIHDDTIGYTEHKNVQVGDVILFPENTGSGPITDTNELTKKGVITEISEDHIKAEVVEGTELILERDSENDWSEEITDVKNTVDLSANGVYVAKKGTVFKAISVAVESPEPEDTEGGE